MTAKNQLRTHFPIIREREEILEEIRSREKLRMIFEGWKREQQDEFIDFVCGNRGIRILYDSFFKETMDAEYDPSRLEDFLCEVLQRKVKILKMLPNDNTRIADETSLLVTDIVVELEDGALANVEIQKIGYLFPGARSACYSSDLLLRQYKRVRDRRGEDFSYRDIRNVYLIVIYENSPQEFRQLSDIYYHRSRQIFESGLQLDLLQEYIMIPLDIFRKHMQNKNIETKLEAWLTFLGDDRPERIIELITKFPQFKAMYQTLYDMCLSTERVMKMFSKELQILDRNTVKYMIEEQQREIEKYKLEAAEKDKMLEQYSEAAAEKDKIIAELRKQLEQQNKLEEK